MMNRWWKLRGNEDCIEDVMPPRVRYISWHRNPDGSVVGNLRMEDTTRLSGVKRLYPLFEVEMSNATDAALDRLNKGLIMERGRRPVEYISYKYPERYVCVGNVRGEH